MDPSTRRWVRQGSSPGGRRRGSARVVADGRFRDEEERKAAIDRLSPPANKEVRASEGARPTPQITRSPKARPRRFKDVMRERNGGLGLNGARRVSGDEEEEEEDPRAAARERRVRQKESEASDRLAYLVAVIRQELGKPQEVLALSPRAREKRFDSLRYRLRNVGFVEIMFALVKYYYAHWNEEEGSEAWEMEAEHKKRLAEEKHAEEREMNDYMDAVEREAVEELKAKRRADGNEESAAWGEEAERDARGEKTRRRREEEDEETRKALLRAAQLKATGVEPASTGGSKDGKDEDKDEEKRNGLLDDLADLAREYFSVDFVEDEAGGKEMVVMTSPEFIAFLLIAIILSGRLGHYLVNTYLISPVDPLLR